MMVTLSDCSTKLLPGTMSDAMWAAVCDPQDGINPLGSDF